MLGSPARVRVVHHPAFTTEQRLEARVRDRHRWFGEFREGRGKVGGPAGPDRASANVVVSVGIPPAGARTRAAPRVPRAPITLTHPLACTAEPNENAYELYTPKPRPAPPSTHQTGWATL